MASRWNAGRVGPPLVCLAGCLGSSRTALGTAGRVSVPWGALVSVLGPVMSLVLSVGLVAALLACWWSLGLRRPRAIVGCKSLAVSSQGLPQRGRAYSQVLGEAAGVWVSESWLGVTLEADSLGVCVSASWAGCLGC